MIATKEISHKWPNIVVDIVTATWVIPYAYLTACGQSFVTRSLSTFVIEAQTLLAAPVPGNDAVGGSITLVLWKEWQNSNRTQPRQGSPLWAV